MNPYLSVIIPCFNEARRIGSTLERVYVYLLEQPFTWELLIVLDGSTDGTPDVVKTWSIDKKGVHWIDRRENKGKGYSVREGMVAVRGKVRLFMDADNARDIAHFDLMKPLFDQNYDVVICSRSLRDAPGAREIPSGANRIRKVLGRAGNLCIQAIVLPGLWDTQCGFKAFTQQAAESIFASSRIDGWAFDVEALVLARIRDFRVGIVPAESRNHPETHVKPYHYARALRDTIRVRLNLFRGVYRDS
jgi:glycosyltransferase involved in cell wall biosynthesis